MKALSGPHEIEIAGHLLAWNPERHQPCGVRIEGQVFVPIFSTKERLRACMSSIAAPAYRVKVIDDAAKFLDLMAAAKIPIALDPRRENGRLLFSLVLLYPQDMDQGAGLEPASSGPNPEVLPLDEP